jgi:5-enolpyruvylshikimate-3-phosphate synthase
VDTKEVRIMGSKSVSLRALVAASSAKKAGFGVPSFGTEVARHSEQNYELVCIEIAL